MAENLIMLREQLKTSNDFEQVSGITFGGFWLVNTRIFKICFQNGVTSQNPKILEENINLKKENQSLRRIKEAFGMRGLS